MAYIYKISNDINDKVYIGKTIYTPEKRLVGHFQAAFHPRMENNKFAIAIREIGKEHFKTEALEECDDEIAGEREKYWIQYYNSFINGYNSSRGGERDLTVDRKPVIELYQKLKSQYQVANELGISQKTVYRILKKANIEKATPREVQEQIGNIIPIYAYDKNGNFVKSFDAIIDAAKWCIEKEYTQNKNPRQANGHIIQALKGQRKTSYGFQWRYDYKNYIEPLESNGFGRGVKKKIQMLNKDTKEVLNIFESASEAGRFLGDVKKNRHISACAAGKRQTAYGYVWQYV